MAKISDYLAKVNEDLTVNMYNNGFLFTISGSDHDDNWANAKIICATLEEVLELVREATTLPRG